MISTGETQPRSSELFEVPGGKLKRQKWNPKLTQLPFGSLEVSVIWQ